MFKCTISIMLLNLVYLEQMGPPTGRTPCDDVTLSNES